MTRKEIETELSNITQLCQYLHKELGDTKHLAYSLSKVVDAFIKFSGQEEKFMNHLKENSKKEAKDAKENNIKHEKLQKKTTDNKSSK